MFVLLGALVDKDANETSEKSEKLPHKGNFNNGFEDCQVHVLQTSGNF